MEKSSWQIEKEYDEKQKAQKRKHFWAEIAGAGVVILAILSGFGIPIAILMIIAYIFYMTFHG